MQTQKTLYNRKKVLSNYLGELFTLVLCLIVAALCFGMLGFAQVINERLAWWEFNSPLIKMLHFLLMLVSAPVIIACLLYIPYVMAATIFFAYHTALDTFKFFLKIINPNSKSKFMAEKSEVEEYGRFDIDGVSPF